MELNDRVANIKRMLKEQKMTYQQLADMSNISKSTLTHIFMGQSKNPRIDTIEALEKALDINQNTIVNIDTFIKNLNLNALSQESKDIIAKFVYSEEIKKLNDQKK